MTEANDRYADVIILERDARSFAALLGPVRGFERADGADAALDGARAFDLDALLGLTADDGAAGARLLWVASGRRPVALQTAAYLRLAQLPPAAFWRLPRVLRQAGCASWIRGFVDVAHGAETGVVLAVWIDLEAVAVALPTTPVDAARRRPDDVLGDTNARIGET